MSQRDHSVAFQFYLEARSREPPQCAEAAGADARARRLDVYAKVVALVADPYLDPTKTPYTLAEAQACAQAQLDRET